MFVVQPIRYRHKLLVPPALARFVPTDQQNCSAPRVEGKQHIKHENAPLPAPLLVHIHKGSTFNDLTYLSEQVLKFTGLSWRSTLPAKKPVSIYYSELIADLLGRLRSVPGWSPAILNTRLRASRWFL